MLKRVKMGALLLVLLVAGLMAAIYSSGREELYSNPATPRPNAAYTAAYAQPTSTLPAMPENFFAQFQFRASSTQWMVTMPPPVSNQPAGKYTGPLRTLNADKSNVVTYANGGTIRLAFIGTLHSAPLRVKAPSPSPLRALTGQGLFRSAATPLRIFRADLTPALEEDLQHLIAHKSKAVVSDHYPLARFYFAHTNLPALQAATIEVFDGRTQWPLGSSRSPSSQEGAFYFDVPIRAWHQTALELVATMNTGLEEVTVEVEPGAELEFSGGKIRILAITDRIRGPSNSTRDQRGIMTVNLIAPGDRAPGCTILLQTWPGVANFPGEIRFLDAAGREVRNSRSSGEGHVKAVELSTPLERVRTLRIRHYPQAERVVFRLAELPGLPDENRGVKNLFDVQVPYAFLGSEYQFQELVRNIVQLDAHHFALSYPGGYFPVERTNTSARELFLEIEGLLPNPSAHLVANAENCVIDLRKYPVKARLQRLKMRLGF